MDFKTVDLFIDPEITEKQIDQLIQFTSEDADIHKFTRDKSRFLDKKNIEEWKSKASAIFTLADASKNLLGLIWFENMQIPLEQFTYDFEESAYNDTFAIRLYAQARGKGLAAWFMEHAINRYSTRNLWLKTSHDNHPAVRSYTKFGFIPVSKPDEQGKIIMILPESRI